MGRKLWTDGEVHLLLDYLSENLETFNTGVKERFYGGSRQFLEKDGHARTSTQIKTKLIDLDIVYKKYKQKLGKSGFGIKTKTPPSNKRYALNLFYATPFLFSWQVMVTPRLNSYASTEMLVLL